MVKHIVLFKLKSTFDGRERKAAVEGIVSGLMGLKEQIPEIVEISVNENKNPKESFDLALECLFRSMEDLHSYKCNPIHEGVANRFVRPMVEGRACVDYIV